MSNFALIILAFGMSMDAFAVTLARSTSMIQSVGFWQLLRISLVFGLVEMITPLIGFTLGVAASSIISEWDHWLAFVLLAGLGGHMIYENLSSTPALFNNTSPSKHTQSLLLLLTTAFATSIDSMIVGVGLAFLEVNIFIAAMIIGIATTLMSGLGLWLGHSLGNKLGRWAELLGGMILIGIGTTVLIEHLGLFTS